MSKKATQLTEEILISLGCKRLEVNGGLAGSLYWEINGLVFFETEHPNLFSDEDDKISYYVRIGDNLEPSKFFNKYIKFNNTDEFETILSLIDK